MQPTESAWRTLFSIRPSLFEAAPSPIVPTVIVLFRLSTTRVSIAAVVPMNRRRRSHCTLKSVLSPLQSNKFSSSVLFSVFDRLESIFLSLQVVRLLLLVTQLYIFAAGLTAVSSSLSPRGFAYCDLIDFNPLDYLYPIERAVF